MTKARDDESTGQPSQGVKATGVLKVRGDKLHLLHHKRVRKIRTKHSQAMAEMRYEQAKLRRENAMLKRQLVTITQSCCSGTAPCAHLVKILMASLATAPSSVYAWAAIRRICAAQRRTRQGAR